MKKGMIRREDVWGAVQPQVVDLVRRMIGRPTRPVDGARRIRGCRVISTSTQNINTGAVIPLAFTEEINDTDGCWVVENPTKLTATRSGYYIAGGGWTLLGAQNTVASRMTVIVRVNGSVIVGGNDCHTIAGKAVGISVTTGQFWMNAGDYVEICALHDEGATKTAAAGSTTNQQFINGWLQFIGV